jgi:hypothetical protein
MMLLQVLARLREGTPSLWRNAERVRISATGTALNYPLGIRKEQRLSVELRPWLYAQVRALAVKMCSDVLVFYRKWGLVVVFGRP